MSYPLIAASNTCMGAATDRTDNEKQRIRVFDRAGSRAIIH